MIVSSLAAVAPPAVVTVAVVVAAVVMVTERPSRPVSPDSLSAGIVVSDRF